MRIQKTYIGYCICTWCLWCLPPLLSLFCGNAYIATNIAFFNFTSKFAAIALVVSWIPMHPVLFVAALISSMKHKRHNHVSFNIFSFLFTTIVAFFYLVFYVWLCGI